jgi:hypothetical protein
MALVKTIEVPNTISIVEEFFGSALTLDLIKVIEDTPLYQLVELADRLARHQRRLQSALNRRSTFSPYDDYRIFVEREYAIHDRIYLHGHERTALIDDPDLPYVLLYSTHTLMPDATLSWAMETILLANMDRLGEARSITARLVRGLESMIPLRELIRRGYVVPIATMDSFHPDEFLFDQSLDHATRLDDPGGNDIYWRDPLLAWILVKKLKCIPSWELNALDLARPEDMQEAASRFLGEIDYDDDVYKLCMKAVKVAYPESSFVDVQDAVRFGFIHRESRTVPMASQVTTGKHLTRSSLAILEGLSTPAVDTYRPELDAIGFRIPSLRGVSLADIVRLRLQEDIYEDARSCLVELLQIIRQEAPANNYGQYVKTLRNCADDIVGPTYENLSNQARRAKLSALLGGLGAGGLTSLAFNAVSALLTGPGAVAIKSAGNPAGNIARKSVEKRTQRKRRAAELEIACSILVTILPRSSR